MFEYKLECHLPLDVAPRTDGSVLPTTSPYLLDSLPSLPRNGCVPSPSPLALLLGSIVSIVGLLVPLLWVMLSNPSAG